MTPAEAILRAALQDFADDGNEKARFAISMVDKMDKEQGLKPISPNVKRECAAKLAAAVRALQAAGAAQFLSDSKAHVKGALADVSAAMQVLAGD